MSVATWTDPAWLAAAHAWIDARLAELGITATGPPERRHLQPWSTVLRVPTQQGDLYFKANMPTLRHEAALVEILARRRPDLVPPLVAVDRDRGWMLMGDAGTRLREIVERERDLSPWLEILPLYAGLQIELMDDADALLAAGVPDLRLATLAGTYERVLGDLPELPPDERRRLEADVPRIAELCEQLAGYGLPETVQHDDFHDGQVYVRDGRYLFLDWGDACVSHPFFTLSVTLEGVLAWGFDDVEGSVDTTAFREAYLGAFEQLASHADLEAAAAIALRLGWICRAVNCHLSGSDPAQTLERLGMF